MSWRDKQGARPRRKRAYVVVLLIGGNESGGIRLGGIKVTSQRINNDEGESATPRGGKPIGRRQKKTSGAATTHGWEGGAKIEDWGNRSILRI